MITHGKLMVPKSLAYANSAKSPFETFLLPSFRCVCHSATQAIVTSSLFGSTFVPPSQPNLHSPARLVWY